MTGARCGDEMRLRSHKTPPRRKGTGRQNSRCAEVFRRYLPPEAAMISCSIATWRAKAPRPAAVAVTVVCGFLPTKAFSTAT